MILMAMDLWNLWNIAMDPMDLWNTWSGKFRSFYTDLFTRRPKRPRRLSNSSATERSTER